MKVNTKLRMLPFDYLKKIGRYNPEIHTEKKFPGYPLLMINELNQIAKEGKIILSGMPLMKARVFRGLIRISTQRGSTWKIPSNWVVRV